MCSFHGGQAMHLLKGCNTMRSYVKGSFNLNKGKVYKPPQKAHKEADRGKDDGTNFPNAEECLMIFGGAQAYESRRQRRITEQEVIAFEAMVVPTRLRWSELAITFDQGDHPTMCHALGGSHSSSSQSWARCASPKSSWTVAVDSISSTLTPTIR